MCNVRDFLAQTECQKFGHSPRTIPITQNKKDGCVLKIFVMFVFVSVKVSVEMLAVAAWAEQHCRGNGFQENSELSTRIVRPIFPCVFAVGIENAVDTVVESLFSMFSDFLCRWLRKVRQSFLHLRFTQRKNGS